MADVTFTFRVDQALKDEFVRVAKSRDLNASQLLRMYMRDFTREETPEEGYAEWLEAKVAKSLQQMRDGQTLSADEVAARFERWKRK
jgi:antitoxin component of RelBE/YafQ-DinJ toxin-antitoxin module